MFGSSYHMDGVTAFHVPSLSFVPRYSWEIVLFIHMYNISTPLHNCMVEFEYGICSSLHNRMVEFKYGVFHI